MPTTGGRAGEEACKADLPSSTPFDDPGSHRRGQGTIASGKSCASTQGPLPHAVFVAIGGGGARSSGIASYIKAVRPEIKRRHRRTDLARSDSGDATRWLSARWMPRASARRHGALKEVGLFSDFRYRQSSWSARRPSARHPRELVGEIIPVWWTPTPSGAGLKDVFQDTRSILSPRARWPSPA
ncbi:hypothetical protein ACU4GD_29150 [Cupriavidus basilensis]